MKKYKIIYLEPELPSFSWQKGLYFVYKEIDNEVYLGKIKSDGTPDCYDDGNYNILITGKGNKGIIPTNLTIEL